MRYRLTVGLFWLTVLFLLAMVVAIAGWLTRIPARAVSVPKAPAQPEWPATEAPPAELWSVFKAKPSAPAAPEGAWGRRFRLAGTFFEFSEVAAENASPASRAILDDLEKKQQYLVREGDSLEGARVGRILKDHVVLQVEGREETLWLSYLSAATSSSVPAPPGAKGGVDTDGPALETTRFGKRVGDARWVVKRDALMEYYQELMDNPERLASIFLSLKPDYNAENRIAGYVLDVEGEGPFFKDVGLLPGDKVRKVNSMNMTSQARAEYFIGEFVKSRLNAVVIDIERDGQAKKLIYMIR